MSAHFTTSHSEVETYQSCPRKHFYSYGLNLRLKNTVDSLPLPLRRGVMGHEIQEIFFLARQAGLAYDAAVSQANDALKKHAALDPEAAAPIVTPLATFYAEERENIERWKILEVEQPRLVYLDDYNRMIYIPDLVAEIDGRIRVIDNKFVANYYHPKDIKYLTQIPKYIGGLKADYVIGGGEYLMFRTHKYTKAEDSYRMEPDDPSSTKIKTILQDQLRIAQEVAYFKGLPVEDWRRESVRNMDKQRCSWCSYEPICMIELDGGSPKAEIKMNYETHEPSEFRAADGIL